MMNGPFLSGHNGQLSSSLEVNPSSSSPLFLTPSDEYMMEQYGLMCIFSENTLKEQYGENNVIAVEHIDPDKFIDNLFHGQNNNGNNFELKIEDPQLVELVEHIKQCDVIGIAKVPNSYLGDLRMIENGESWPVETVNGIVNYNGENKVHLGVCDEHGQYLDVDDYNTWERLYASDDGVRWSDDIEKLILTFVLDNNTFSL